MRDGYTNTKARPHVAPEYLRKGWERGRRKGGKKKEEKRKKETKSRHVIHLLGVRSGFLFCANTVTL